jgi:hypothetical protein
MLSLTLVETMAVFLLFRKETRPMFLSIPLGVQFQISLFEIQC